MIGWIAKLRDDEWGRSTEPCQDHCITGSSFFSKVALSVDLPAWEALSALVSRSACNEVITECPTV